MMFSKTLYDLCKNMVFSPNVKKNLVQRQSTKYVYFCCISQQSSLYNLPEGTACYAGLLLASAEGFGLWRKLFFALWAKKEFSMLFVLTLGHFCYSVVTSIMFCSNLSNFETQPKNLQIILKKMSKKIQNSNNKKSKKILKNPINF